MACACSTGWSRTISKNSVRTAAPVRFDFYQLMRDPAEKIVPLLAARIVADGGRAAVVSQDRDQLHRLSEGLWNAQPTSFLAHAIVGDGTPDLSLQPILLDERPNMANGAANLILADGIWRDAPGGTARIFYLFPPERTEQAREAWRALAGQEAASRHFWEQSESGWIEKG